MNSFKKNLYPILLAFITFSLFTGCATTGDPTQGGIFWSEDKAKDRILKLENEKNQEEDFTARLILSNSELENKKKGMKSEIMRQEKQLAAMDVELNKLEKQLAQKQQLGAKERAKKEKVERELSTLKQELAAMQRNQKQDQASMEKKKQKIAELNMEIDLLLEVMASL